MGTGSENLTAGATQDAGFPKDATSPDPEEGGQGADATTNTGARGTDTGESLADDHLPDPYDRLGAEEMPEFDVELMAASIMLVMDRSGSMVGANWAAAKSAFQDVIGLLALSTRVGLQLYPESVKRTISNEPILGPRL